MRRLCDGELRRLKLGFRAPYVHLAAVAVLEGRLDLQHLVRAPYDETKVELMALRGIGDKIADCIALMSLEKLEAIPIDVWVRRALAEWYFPGAENADEPDPVAVGTGEYFGRLCRIREPVLVPRPPSSRQEIGAVRRLLECLPQHVKQHHYPHADHGCQQQRP